MAPPRDCPCHSILRDRLRYAACCGPIHAGTRKAETPKR
ncbi:hypothetical protein AKJ09_07390 [Labilithrix luteola]|uniref:Uncharacterized protein n=1 Tax=Labilithrix luteola TaxID=1391654 RepID=A0A0K1Q502_9BACT|nr:hypothetical protein AKJ09_07390 [Labilithrix luteola]